MPEKLVRDKHSSLLRKLINYGRKKFYNMGPRDQWLRFPSLVCLWARPTAYLRVDHLKGVSLGQAPDVPANTILSWKGLASDKHSSLLRIFVNYAQHLPRGRGIVLGSLARDELTQLMRVYDWPTIEVDLSGVRFAVWKTLDISFEFSIVNFLSLSQCGSFERPSARKATRKERVRYS